MTRLPTAVLALRAFLVVLFALLVLLQTFSLPGQFVYMAQQSPDQAHLRWPMTALAAFWLLCAEVVVVCTWRLLTLVGAGRIFTADSLRWVDAIVVAIGAAEVVLLGVLVAVGLNADDPGILVLLFALATGVGVLGLLMVVMRALLRQATELRTDLAGVI